MFFLPWNLKTLFFLYFFFFISVILIFSAGSVPFITKETELSMGRSANKEVLKQFGIYQSKALEIYVNKIGQNLISKLIRKESSKNLNVNDIINTKSCCKNCVNGLLAFSENKKNKARSYFKKGSKNCDYCQINKDFKKKKYSAIEEIRLTEFDMYDLKYNGIEMNCLDISTNQSNEFYTQPAQTRNCKKINKDSF